METAHAIISQAFSNSVIVPGKTTTQDVLHRDFGITGMRLNTDTQHAAHVLKEGETDVPSGIPSTLSVSNKPQDIAMNMLKVGLTGNQILSRSLAEMKNAGVDGAVYSHTIGDDGSAELILSRQTVFHLIR